jgi:hypothetical protein
VAGVTVLLAVAGTVTARVHAGDKAHDCTLHGGVAHGLGLAAAPGIEMVHACWPGEDGTLTGRLIPQETLTPENLALRAELDRSYARAGTPDRIDVVFIGDGYTASEQGLFTTDAQAIIADMFVYEPFTTYEPFFRFHLGAVVSNESGVDNDPVQGISRDTALDMRFWCGGTERALCVNVNKALTAARAATLTDVDQVLAIANTVKYGGVGYPTSNVGTASGRNELATQIVIHELGHSLGDLADEYDYGGPADFAGGEPGTANVSIFDAAAQLAQSRKWFRWLGANMPGFDGTVLAFEGANYSTDGIYRPTDNSMMRSLSRPFNLPSAERLIVEFYREVGPIEDATPADAVVSGADTVFAVPVQPNGHDLDISWSIDGSAITSLNGQTHANLAALGFDDGVERELTVTVVDNTPWVRDPALRASFLTESRSWTVNECVERADFDQSGTVEFFDVLAYLLFYTGQQPEADLDGSGVVDYFDLLAFLNAFNNPCPA